NQAVEATRVDVKYKEPPLLLRNDGKGSFQETREGAGGVFQTSYSARGLAVGDWNNDGRADAVFTCLNGPLGLLRNDPRQETSWIGLELQGTISNRDAIGAKITIEAGGRKLLRWLTGGSSYLSSHDKRILVGLGSGSVPSNVGAEIRWPNGEVQRLTGLKVGQYHHIVEPRPAP